MTRRKKPVVDIRLRSILEEPVSLLDGKATKITPYEAGMRKCAVRAAQGNMRDARRFILQCLRYGVLPDPEPLADDLDTLLIPKDWDHRQWHEMYDRLGAPPWPGPRDGLIPPERWALSYPHQPRPKTRARRNGR